MVPARIGDEFGLRSNRFAELHELLALCERDITVRLAVQFDQGRETCETIASGMPPYSTANAAIRRSRAAVSAAT